MLNFTIMKKYIYFVITAIILLLSACGENIPALPGKLIVKHKTQVQEKPNLVLTDLPEGWTQIPINTNNCFEDFYFLNEKSGWLITSGEGICNVFKTNNGGSSWIKDSILSKKFPEQIYFINQKTGFICGELFSERTINGGKTWDTISDISNYMNQRIDFANQKLGYLPFGGEFGGLYITQNSGKNWFSANVPANIDCCIGYAFFLNSLTGWCSIGCTCQREMSITHDGGKHWKTIAETSPQHYVFTDYKTGWGIDGDTITKTNNSGKSWQRYQIDYLSLPIKFFFLNKSQGFLLCKKEIHYSKDAGKSWEIIIKLPGDITFSNMYFKNPNIGYAIGTFGLLKFSKY